MTDVLKFMGGPLDGELCEWIGEWPPDERIGVAVGRATGQTKLFDPETVGLYLEEVETVADIVYYRRVIASTVPPHPRVVRGATYEQE
jgi:hypothetical protein